MTVFDCVLVSSEGLECVLETEAVSHPLSSEKRLVRGDSRDFDLFVRRPFLTHEDERAPEAVDLTNAVITFTMKLLRDDGRSVHAQAPVLVKSSDNTAEIELGSETGHATLHLEHEDTRFLEPGVYGYDVQVRLGNKYYTVARGRLYLSGDFTAAEDSSVP